MGRLRVRAGQPALHDDVLLGRRSGFFVRKPAGYNLTYAIVEELGRAIVTGVYHEGNPFPIEAALCEQFNASRTVLREAIKMLTAKGLLSARPRQGTILEPESRWNLLDPEVLRWLLERKFSLPLLAEFTEIRLAIEPMAARLAARQATPEGIAGIRRALERMQDAEQGTGDPLASDIDFHVAILRASGNRFYSQFDEFIATALGISIRLTNRFKGVAMGNIRDHRKILTAIEAGDADRAEAATKVLLQEVVRLIQSETAASRNETKRKR